MLIIPVSILAIESDSDRAYMTMIYKQHRALMFKTAWKYVHERPDVEDIVSESCTSLIRKINVIRQLEQNALSAYIVTTVRNTAIDFCRKQQRVNLHFLQSADEAIAELPSAVSVEAKIMLRDEIAQVRKALLQLSQREREVLRLKFQLGLKDKEIAQEVGLSESSVRKYIARARNHLKESLY